MKKYIVSIIVLGCLCVVTAFAQGQRDVRRFARSGNDQYNSEHFQEAEMDYRRALAINPQDSVARFNLATALIRQEDQAKLAEADSILTGLAQEAAQSGNNAMAARSLYQKGEIAMMAQQYQQAADAFKESLKRNPKDDDARFNYLLAKKQLENQQNQDQQNQQNQDQQQQQQQQEQQQQNQNQDQKDQQNQEQQQQEQPQQQQQQMSEDQRQSILEQNEREEKETQAKVMQRQQQKDKEKEREREIKRMNGTLKDW